MSLQTVNVLCTGFTLLISACNRRTTGTFGDVQGNSRITGNLAPPVHHRGRQTGHRPASVCEYPTPAMGRVLLLEVLRIIM